MFSVCTPLPRTRDGSRISEYHILSVKSSRSRRINSWSSLFGTKATLFFPLFLLCYIFHILYLLDSSIPSSSWYQHSFLLFFVFYRADIRSVVSGSCCSMERTVTSKGDAIPLCPPMTPHCEWSFSATLLKVSLVSAKRQLENKHCFMATGCTVISIPPRNSTISKQHNPKPVHQISQTDINRNLVER